MSRLLSLHRYMANHKGLEVHSLLLTEKDVLAHCYGVKHTMKNPAHSPAKVVEVPEPAPSVEVNEEIDVETDPIPDAH